MSIAAPCYGDVAIRGGDRSALRSLIEARVDEAHDYVPLGVVPATPSESGWVTAVAVPMFGLRSLPEVLVEEAAQYVVPLDVERRGSDNGGLGARHRHAKVKSPVRTLFVVMPDVLAQNRVEVTTAEDEHPVEAFCPYRPHPTFRIGVGPRRANRCLDHPDALGGEYLVEAGCELRIPVPDQELDRSTAVDEVTDEVARHLGDEGSGRMVCDAEDGHFSSSEFDHEEHVELSQGDRVHGEEVRGQHHTGVRTQELRPRRSAPRHGTEPM